MAQIRQLFRRMFGIVNDDNVGGSCISGGQAAAQACQRIDQGRSCAGSANDDGDFGASQRFRAARREWLTTERRCFAQQMCSNEVV